MPAIGYFHDLIYICPPSPFQHAAAAGLAAMADGGFYRELATSHQAKRDQLCAALEDSGFRAPRPDGAYYVFADASHLPGSTAPERARYLLRQTGVASVAGSAFFTTGRGDHMLRFCFGKRDIDLNRACGALRTLKI